MRAIILALAAFVLLGHHALASTSLDLCDNRPTDVIWLLDGSISIGAVNFDTKMKTFVASVAGNFELSQSGLAMGVIQFAGPSFSLAQMMNIPLNARLNTSAFVQRALAMTYMQKGGTATYYALDTAVSIMQTQGRDSLLTGEILIVITDGQSQDEARTIQAADRARSLGMNVIAVTVGDGYRVTEAQGIAGNDPAMLFNVENFNALGGVFVTQLSHLICDAPIRWPDLTPISNLGISCSLPFVPVQFMITQGSSVPVSLTVTSLGYGLRALRVCLTWSSTVPAWSNITAITTPITCQESPTVLLLGSTVGLRRASMFVSSVSPSTSPKLQLFMGIFPLADPTVYYDASRVTCANNISVSATMPTPSTSATPSVSASITATRTRTPVTASMTPSRTRSAVTASATRSPASATTTATPTPPPSTVASPSSSVAASPANPGSAITGGSGDGTRDSSNPSTNNSTVGGGTTRSDGGTNNEGSASQTIVLGGILGGVILFFLLLCCCLFWFWWRPRKLRLEMEARRKLQQAAQAESWAAKGSNKSKNGMVPFFRSPGVGGSQGTVHKNGPQGPKPAVPRLSMALQSLKPNATRRVSEFGKRHSQLAFHPLGEASSSSSAEVGEVQEAVGVIDDDDEGGNEQDDSPDQEEDVASASAKAGAKGVQPWKRTYDTKIKHSASNAVTPAVEKKKLVIGGGALVEEKITEQRVVLRRVSNVKGDKEITALRKQAAARPSVAATFSSQMATAGTVETAASAAGAARTAGGTGNGTYALNHEALGIYSPYSFNAAVARRKIRVPTKRVLTGASSPGSVVSPSDVSLGPAVNPLDDDDDGDGAEEA